MEEKHLEVLQVNSCTDFYELLNKTQIFILQMVPVSARRGIGGGQPTKPQENPREWQPGWMVMGLQRWTAQSQSQKGNTIIE